MRTTIEMAREAGIFVANNVSMVVIAKDQLERFAELVRADERARMAEQPAPVQGWRMVPVQPTDEMRDVGNVIIKDRGALFAAYRAMLDAAPQPPAQRTWVEVEQVKWEGERLIAKLKEKNNGN